MSGLRALSTISTVPLISMSFAAFFVVTMVVVYRVKYRRIKKQIDMLQHDMNSAVVVVSLALEGLKKLNFEDKKDSAKYVPLINVLEDGVSSIKASFYHGKLFK